MVVVCFKGREGRIYGMRGKEVGRVFTCST